jgi:phosphatidylglycerol:prolipoprotein diacylglycerol transferase
VHSSFVQLGHLHIPIFGVFAALGLMTALALSQRTARYAGLAPAAVWNAGMTAIVSAFVISRLLLIAFNLRSFLQYPLLILALPSLTSLGILSTALFMLGYIRWRKLPLFPLLDAATPCAALLWFFLSLGRYFDGTRDGMPTQYWTIHSNPIATRTQPVEIYTALAAFFVFFRTWRLLRKRHVKPQVPAGTVAAIALVVSGSLIFVLDFFHLPSDLLPNSFLDPSQIIAIAMVLVGAALLLRARTEIKRESGNEPPHAI